MDNPKSSDLMKENLLKIIIGDEVGSAMLTALLQFGLIQHKPSVTEHGYELTPKGMDRLNGI